jgi:uncharacterized repeat protein (TIGR03803 family)
VRDTALRSVLRISLGEETNLKAISITTKRIVSVCVLLALASLGAAYGAPQSVIYSFDGALGGIPRGPLIQATDGLLYGTTEFGPYGPNNNYTSGTVFRVNRDSKGQFSSSSSITVIYAFSQAGINPINTDGANAACNLLQTGVGINGAPILYGTTTYGGANGDGVVFLLTPNPASPTGYTETTLHSFDSAGGSPLPSLTLASDGNLYGATLVPNSSAGTVYRISPTGAFATVHTFSNGAANHPQYGVVQASDGNLYGVTGGDGATYYGYIYRLTLGGTFSVIHTFLAGQTDGCMPTGLLVGNDGNLYGTTQFGGLHGYGTVFQCTLAGVVTLIHSFAGTDGMYPQAVPTQGLDGNLYGATTNGGTVAPGSTAQGTVFQISPDQNGTLSAASPFALLYSFPMTSGTAVNLKVPNAGVIQNADGYLYGTAPCGGNGVNVFGFADDYGGIYSIQTGPAVATPVTVAIPAAATPSPVTGTSTSLSVLGGYLGTGGADALTYTWSCVGPGSVTYSANGTNAAKNTTATFSELGSYTFTATIAGPYSSTTSSVNVTINQTLTSIAVTPGPTLTLGPPLPQAQQFAATGLDQFGNAMSTQPSFLWARASGVGSINASSGLYHSGSTPGSAAIAAKTGLLAGTCVIAVDGPSATVATAASATPNPVTGLSANLSVLGGYSGTGGSASLTYTWAETAGPAGVTFSPNGTNEAANSIATFVRAGNYTLQVTIAVAYGASATSSVNVTVNQTLISIAVTPGPALIINPPLPGIQQFAATLNDQFGNPLSPQPAIIWGLAAGSIGSITDTGGLYHSGKVPGTATVKAKSGAVIGICAVTVN